MAAKPESMSVRFVRPSDEGAIKRVQRAAQTGAVTVVDNTPGIKQFMELREKVRSLDTSVIFTESKKSLA